MVKQYLKIQQQFLFNNMNKLKESYFIQIKTISINKLSCLKESNDKVYFKSEIVFNNS